MASFKRRILGLAIIAAGVCAAMLFRTDTTTLPADTAKSNGTEQVTSSSNSGLTLHSNFSQPESLLRLNMIADPQDSATPSPSPQPTVPDRPATQSLQRLVLRKPAMEEPPRVASKFERFTETVPSESIAFAETRDVERRHQISDGDTLERIALRHFGDREQWRAIFEANRDVLSSPDLLPIGQEITIPIVPDDDGLVPIK